METYEQKYKSLVGKIKRAYMNAWADSTKAVLEEIFPELVESEDEKIRREMLKESACEDLEKAVQAYSNLYNDECFDAIGNECPYIKNAFKAGANWQKVNLWKPADGDDLPEINREVIALVEEFGHYKVVFAHRPPEHWDGKNILTGEVTRYYPKRYDKGNWNQPNVKWWLDIEVPKTKMEDEE